MWSGTPNTFPIPQIRWEQNTNMQLLIQIHIHKHKEEIWQNKPFTRVKLFFSLYQVTG